MNANALKALGLDALHQVLDNWVFRILVVLAGVVVLFTFTVGFREEEMVFLFGLKTLSYERLLSFFGASTSIPNAQGIVISTLVTLVFDYLAGNLGVIFCIAATAFFVPQMIEKGAADVLFHKPLARLTFYLARYFAGLLFVGILASIMSAGIYLGLAVVSGWHDPGILFAAPLLTYVFALVFPVSMLVGVVTRSTVASILLTTLFFTFNGCVHFGWTQLRMASEEQDGRRERAAAERGDEEIGLEPEEDDLVVRVLSTTLTGLHYVLPKTGDADVMASKLRREVNPPVLEDERERVALFALPDGFVELEPEPPGVPPAVAALLGEPRFACEGDVDGALVRATLLVRPVSEREVERRGETTRVRETLTGSASELRQTLAAAGYEDVQRAVDAFGDSQRGSQLTGVHVSWAGSADQALLFKGARGDTLYSLWIDDAAVTGVDGGERRALVTERVGGRFGLLGEVGAYERRFTLDAPWRYNILFSVGSSLAFVLLCLSLGWWKLSRIEF